MKPLMIVRNGFFTSHVQTTMKTFEDHFSPRAQTYLRHRPAYPKALYRYLSSIAPGRHMAWDCGTGNGQAALGLVEYFDRVIATDASAEQLSLAPKHERIDFRLAHAETSGLEPKSVALVTSAVAVHWFDLDQFYPEVRRVLLPGGIIAVWCYSLQRIEPGIDAIIRHYFNNTLSGYWPEKFRYIKEQYRTLPFPFDELTAPRFSMETRWELSDVVGFLSSWSGTVNYEKREGRNPVDLILPDLSRAWGSVQKRAVSWQLFTRVGRL